MYALSLYINKIIIFVICLKKLSCVFSIKYISICVADIGLEFIGIGLKTKFWYHPSLAFTYSSDGLISRVGKSFISDFSDFRRNVGAT